MLYWKDSKYTNLPSSWQYGMVLGKVIWQYDASHRYGSELDIVIISPPLDFKCDDTKGSALTQATFLLLAGFVSSNNVIRDNYTFYHGFYVQEDTFSWKSTWLMHFVDVLHLLLKQQMHIVVIGFHRVLENDELMAQYFCFLYWSRSTCRTMIMLGKYRLVSFICCPACHWNATTFVPR